MAFDPHWEDYQRLGLRYTYSLADQDAVDVSKAFATFSHRFAQNRDSLPQTDADRAFHLVADAATLIDQQLPFATDEEAETIIAHGHRLLDEAIALDPECHDAIRMKMSADCPSFESYYDFLKREAPAVKASCERHVDKATHSNSSDRAALETYLALCPYLRWLSTLAAKAVICGRNREALRITDELFALDPTDVADARFTAALAFAKLEDEQGIEKLARIKSPHRPRNAEDAWIRLSLASVAYRRLAYREARDHISHIVKSYPYAAPTLALQRELPDGVYARLAVQPCSEDELVVAVSEATVLLQEGRDAFGKGAFGSWVMLEALGLATPEELSDIADLVENVAHILDDPTWRAGTGAGYQGTFEDVGVWEFGNSDAGASTSELGTEGGADHGQGGPSHSQDESTSSQPDEEGDLR